MFQKSVENRKKKLILSMKQTITFYQNLMFLSPQLGLMNIL